VTDSTSDCTLPHLFSNFPLSNVALKDSSDTLVPFLSVVFIRLTNPPV
jgi:hypothetical protein